MDENIRINKYFSDAGGCSRREADRLTEAGRVTVRGTVVSTGEKIFPDEEICIDGKPIKKQEKKILLLFMGGWCYLHRRRVDIQLNAD